jgi:radical SAM protein with 4Fe4S-binding SPASM domain
MSNDTINHTINYINHIKNLYNDVRINFFGGEPLLKVDTINEFISLLQDKVSYCIITNGFLLDTIVDKLLYWNDISNKKLNIIVSYDYFLQNETRCANTYNKVRNNIKLLHDIGLDVSTITVFPRNRLNVFYETYKDFLYLKEYIPSLIFYFNVDRRNIISSTFDRKAILQSLKNAKMVDTNNTIVYNCYTSINDYNKQKYCITDNYYSAITPEGDIYPIGNIAHDFCIRDKFYLGNVKEDFTILCQNRETLFNNIKIVIPTPCKTCNTNCKIPKWNLLDIQTDTIPDIELCIIQKIIQSVFKL